MPSARRMRAIKRGLLRTFMLGPPSEKVLVMGFGALCCLWEDILKQRQVKAKICQLLFDGRC
jgi:hypothetical protein